MCVIGIHTTLHTDRLFEVLRRRVKSWCVVPVGTGAVIADFFEEGPFDQTPSYNNSNAMWEDTAGAGGNSLSGDDVEEDEEDRENMSPEFPFHSPPPRHFNNLEAPTPPTSATALEAAQMASGDWPSPYPPIPSPNYVNRLNDS